MHKPTQTHWTTAKRFFRYLKQIISHGIHLNKSEPHTLTTFSNANWAEKLDDRTSIPIYINFLGTNHISWSSKKQQVIAKSSIVAEYRALANAASETVWLHSFLSELGFTLHSPPEFLCDNIEATHFSFNLVNHSFMKHIQINLHFVCDLVQQGSIQVKHVVHTQDQLTDLLTKPRSRHQTQLLCSKIGLANGISTL